MDYSWKLTEQEEIEVAYNNGDMAEAQEAKKQAFREAGGIILNPDALEDMYEALKGARAMITEGTIRQRELALEIIVEALAKAEGELNEDV